MSLKGWVILTVCVVVVTSISVMYWDTFANNSPTTPKEPEVLSYLKNEGFIVSTSKTDFLREYFDAMLNYEPCTTTDFEEFLCYAKSSPFTIIYYFEKTGATLINHNNKVIYQYWTEEQANNFDNMLNDVLEAEK